jgi:membrane dipeptidase
MSRAVVPGLAAILTCTLGLGARAGDLAPVSERARAVHEAGMLFDGHNDLPWEIRQRCGGDLAGYDISTRLDTGHTDIPRLRTGGVKAQFCSVSIPGTHAID